MKRAFAGLWVGWAIVAGSAGQAHSQAPPAVEGIAIGGWTFRPAAELRIRGEYRRYPVESGGVFYRSTALLEDGFQQNTPEVVFKTGRVKDRWSIAERARLGLAVDRGPVTGVLTLQDSRVWGQTVPIFTAEQSTLPSFGPWEAYVDLHARKGRRMFLRLGRQKVVWGDGWDPLESTCRHASLSIL